MKPLIERWEVSSFFRDIPRMHFEIGLIAKLTYRKIYLGAMGEVGISEEKEGL